MGRKIVDNRAMVDRLIDDLYQRLGITGADIFQTSDLLRKVCEGMPSYRNEGNYDKIVVAWTYTVPDVVGLLERCGGNHSEPRKLAAACIVLRMQDRERARI